MRERGAISVRRTIAAAIFSGAALLVFGAWAKDQAPQTTTAAPAAPQLPALRRQTQAEADAKSAGCVACHRGIEPMHISGAVNLGCTDCHGGNASVMPTQGVDPRTDVDARNRAHVLPSNREIWKTSANPKNSYTALLKESPEFVKFINPGDLRVAPEVCGPCHIAETNAVPRSTMTTAAVFWAAAPYANGILSRKAGLLGESYDRDGKARAIKPAQPPTAEQIAHGALPILVPMPRWEVLQPGQYFRAFERGGIAQGSQFPDVGNPELDAEAGKPDIRLSNRGRGTGLRIEPGVINVLKTRLNDPHLSFLGTNNHPGDYRSSGCTACHVVYANDRDPANSGPWAQYGNVGLSYSADPMIPKNENAHPIKHQFTRAVPTSQCMSCHMHQPNSFVNTYLGYIMWDYESDASLMFPKEQIHPTEAQKRAAYTENPEGAVVRGLWQNFDFLKDVSKLNSMTKNTQFADYHGHGWNFMAVFKKDRKGNLLDANDNKVSFDDPDKFRKAVHLRDIHLDKGMHCSDCHFSQDEHGNGQLYAEYANNIEIECEDCHGTVDHYATLKTSGPAAPPGGNDLRAGTTPFGRLRFAWVNGKLYQRSMLNKDTEWEVIQVKDTITPGNEHYNEKSRYAKTIQQDGKSWGSTSDMSKLAHKDSRITCYACHTSWMTSCSGCHLPQEQNVKSPMLHYEGIETRNYATYNPQVLRTDTIMLGVNGTTKGHRIAPVRSSSALVLSSTNRSRDHIYIQQPPISAPGYSSQAFNAHIPHTVRSKETQRCNDCHVSKDNDNNAWLAQELLQGTNTVNFVGLYAWLGTEKGPEAVKVTEWDEPQAVIGSSLHKIVYPDYYAEHQKRHMELEEAHEHHGDARSVQMRGEYLFTASGEEGFIVYDIANIDNKDYSERFSTAPFSSFGQRTYLKTKFASAMALPTTMPMAPDRKTQFIPENEEQPIHPLYRYAYIADREEGLILTDVTTLTDGNPSNNFLTRALTWNPNGALTGASAIYVAGNILYMGTDAGLQIIDIDQPLQPKIIATVPSIQKATGIGVQFRYAFVSDAKGLEVIDVTFPSQPRVAATVPIADARSVYVARTYAYVAGGKQGVVIVDIEKPEKPFIDQTFDADGKIEDATDVKVASTNASIYAYVADGKGGLKVLQLTSPEWTPAYAGFSPRPSPRLIAWKETEGRAVSVSKGLDRDRAVDESGHQVSIFNRIGARPMNLEEMQRMYLRDGKLFQVDANPTTPPVTR